jgi:hypothetical protein
VEQAVTLAATLIDPAVAPPGTRLRARVEHAYRAALYVREERSARGAIVAIEDVGGQPGGVLVRGVTDLRSVAPEGRTVVVDLSAAVAWSPRLPAAGRSLADPGQLLPLLEPAGDPFGRAAAARIDALRSALLGRDAQTAETAALALIGLGIGLTPSGDDFLVGLLAGLEATDNGMRRALAVAIAQAAPGRTTSFGAALLEHACRREFSQRLHDVLIAVAGRDHPELRHAIDRAMAYGATSGADTLAGLFLALDVAAAGTATRNVAA